MGRHDSGCVVGVTLGNEMMFTMLPGCCPVAGWEDCFHYWMFISAILGVARIVVGGNCPHVSVLPCVVKNGVLRRGPWPVLAWCHAGAKGWDAKEFTVAVVELEAWPCFAANCCKTFCCA